MLPHLPCYHTIKILSVEKFLFLGRILAEQAGIVLYFLHLSKIIPRSHHVINEQPKKELDSREIFNPQMLGE
jgi:hypothetical protein